MAARKRSAALAFTFATDSSDSSSISSLGSSSNKRRKFTKATFDKWQREHERQHQTLSWLRCVLSRDKLHVEMLYCEVCRKYEARLCSLRNFSNSWIKGLLTSSLAICWTMRGVMCILLPCPNCVLIWLKKMVSLQYLVALLAVVWLARMI